jgi:hypothetical protein
MSDTLIRIKRAVLAGHYEFSLKALDEMDACDLTRLEVAESILNAVAIYKSIRSTSPNRAARRDMLHIIQSTTLSGVAVYTKGKLVAVAGVETYYFLISAKHAE